MRRFDVVRARNAVPGADLISEGIRVDKCDAANRDVGAARNHHTAEAYSVLFPVRLAFSVIRITVLVRRGAVGISPMRNYRASAPVATFP
jgi:hypothetical protein